jgi:hypothetical protein
MQQHNRRESKTMKTKLLMIRTVLAITLWASAAGTYTAQAFYASEFGRWINRDPIGERGFEGIRNPYAQARPILEAPFLLRGRNVEVGAGDVYAFVRNSPISHVDFEGLFGGPAMGGLVNLDPQKKCCENKGGTWQTRADAKFGGAGYDCLEACMTGKIPAVFGGGGVGVWTMNRYGGWAGFGAGAVTAFLFCSGYCFTYACYY